MAQLQQPDRIHRGNASPCRAAVYHFVGVDDPISISGLEVQRRKTTSMANVKGWYPVAEYEDTDLHSGNLDRPELERLLQDAKVGKIDAVIVSSLDRFGGSMVAVVDVVLELSTKGIALVVCQEGIDTTTSAGQFILEIFRTLADVERRSRTKRKKRSQTEKGTRGSIPYGYKRIYYEGTRVLKTIEIAPKQAEIVRRIFELRKQNITLEAIADDVRSLSNSPRGAGWTRTAILRILNNREKYQGGPRGSTGERWPVILKKEDTSDK